MKLCDVKNIKYQSYNLNKTTCTISINILFLFKLHNIIKISWYSRLCRDKMNVYNSHLDRSLYDTFNKNNGVL